MLRTFLDYLLPKDEYKRVQILYFVAESVILTIVLFLCLGVFTLIFNSLTINESLILFITPYLILMYIFFRYISTGLEYGDVFSKDEYRQEKKDQLKMALMSGGGFLIISLFVKGLPTKVSDGWDLFIPSLMFFLSFYLIGHFSLRRSIHKNKELDE